MQGTLPIRRLAGAAFLTGTFSDGTPKAFRAYVLEERPPEEVAHELGVSPGTVYGIKSKILSRLRQKLRQLLD